MVVTEEISHTRAKATGVFLLKKHTGLGRAGIARSFLLHLRLPHSSVDGNWEATARWVVFGISASEPMKNAWSCEMCIRTAFLVHNTCDMCVLPLIFG